MGCLKIKQNTKNCNLQWFKLNKLGKQSIRKDVLWSGLGVVLLMASNTKYLRVIKYLNEQRRFKPNLEARDLKIKA